MECRIPVDEIVLAPESGEHVVFLAHFERGFALPASDFTRKFLDFFGLQPHHLPANAILTLSAFVTCCEAYLGLWPSIDLWAKYFMFRPQVFADKENPGAAKPMTRCAAATVIPRRGSAFPRIQGIESCKKWLKTFFYVNSFDTDKINLPGFIVGPPKEKKNSKYDPKDTLPEINEIHAGILELKAGGMTADDLLATFVYRRLCPLQRRTHKMCFYGCQFDLNRVSTVRLDQAEVRRRVKSIAKTSMPERWEWGMPAYSWKHRPPPRFTVQRNEDGNSSDKRFGSQRRTIDHEDPDSEDHVPIAHADPRCTEANSADPSAAEASDPAAAAAPAREKRGAEKDLPRSLKQKKVVSRGPKPKPMTVGL